MNNKQKVLKILDKYRDKTLSFGCELIQEKELLDWAKRVTLISLDHTRGRVYMRELDGSIFTETSNMLDNCKILGHPLTHADLFRATDKLNTGTAWSWIVSEKYITAYNSDSDEELVIIPLTYLTIEEIPESDPMWKQLVTVFSL